MLALDELRPHLARSALMSARLQLERARTASHTLNAIGLAALVLDEKGKVLAANPLAEAMADHVQWRAHGHFSLKDKSADHLLRMAMEDIGLSGVGGVRSFPVRDDGSMAATLVAHVIQSDCRRATCSCAALPSWY